MSAADRTAESAADYPLSVRQLLKTYDPAQLLWENPADRWAIVAAILTQGNADAREWLAGRLPQDELRGLVLEFRGAGLDEEDRAKLRVELALSESDIPKRPFPSLRWRG